MHTCMDRIVSAHTNTDACSHIDKNTHTPSLSRAQSKPLPPSQFPMQACTYTRVLPHHLLPTFMRQKGSAQGCHTYHCYACLTSHPSMRTLFQPQPSAPGAGTSHLPAMSSSTSDLPSRPATHFPAGHQQKLGGWVPHKQRL